MTRVSLIIYLLIVSIIAFSLNDSDIETIIDSNSTSSNTLLCFGDSLTGGSAQNDSKFCNLTADYLNYSGLYPNILNDNQGIGGTCISNRSAYCSVRSPKNGVDRYVMDITDRDPRIVIIMYGTNDLGYDVDRCAFVEDYQTVITAVKADPSIELVFLNTLTYGWFTNYTQENQTQWNVLIHQLAIDNSLPLIHTAYAIKTNQSLLNDKIHLNEAGGKHLADIINRSIHENNIMSSDRWDLWFNNNESYQIENYSFYAPNINASWGINPVNYADWIKIQNVTGSGMVIDFDLLNSHEVNLEINTSDRYTPYGKYVLFDTGGGGLIILTN